MELVFLGTGAAWPIPRFNCHCAVCEDARKRGSKTNRSRSSIVVRNEKASILIDTSPDMHWQLIREGIEKIDAIFMTHIHFDHTAGMYDVVQINKTLGDKVNMYAIEEVGKRIEFEFFYLMGVIEMHYLKEPVEFGGIKVTPIRVFHGENVPTCGYMFEENGKKIVYISDFAHVSADEKEKIVNPDAIILDGVLPSDEKGETHANLGECVALAEELKAKKLYITHISHKQPPHKALAKFLKKDATPAHDGLRLNF